MLWNLGWISSRCDHRESFASSMIFVVTLLVMIGVWPWMWGVLDRKVFYGEGNIDDAFLNVFFCVGARIRCDLICTRFVQGISPGLQPPILLLEVEGLFYPSEVFQMATLSSVTFFVRFVLHCLCVQAGVLQFPLRDCCLSTGWCLSAQNQDSWPNRAHIRRKSCYTPKVSSRGERLPPLLCWFNSPPTQPMWD